MIEIEFWDCCFQFIECAEFDDDYGQKILEAGDDPDRCISVTLKDLGVVTTKVLFVHKFKKEMGGHVFTVTLDFDSGERYSPDKQYSWNFP